MRQRERMAYRQATRIATRLPRRDRTSGCCSRPSASFHSIRSRKPPQLARCPQSFGALSFAEEQHPFKGAGSVTRRAFACKPSRAHVSGSPTPYPHRRIWRALAGAACQRVAVPAAEATGTMPPPCGRVATQAMWPSSPASSKSSDPVRDVRGTRHTIAADIDQRVLASGDAVVVR